MQNQNTKFQAFNYQQIKGTYIAFLQEDFKLIKQLINTGNKNFVAYNLNKLDKFYKGRALHLQAMTLIGMNAEHLTKLILAKRDYALNKVSSVKISAETGSTDICYSHILIGFKESVGLLNNSSPINYFSGVKPYVMNPYPDIYDKYDYFGRKEIRPEKCLDLLVEVRNSYVHYAGARNEQNGIIWYLYNFVLWLARKEFKDEFKKYKYIGNEESKQLFAK